jgi:cell wall-associated NlpC family hydrolase
MRRGEWRQATMLLGAVLLAASAAPQATLAQQQQPSPQAVPSPQPGQRQHPQWLLQQRQPSPQLQQPQSQQPQRPQQLQQSGAGQRQQKSGQPEPPSARSPLNMVRTAPEQIGQVPSYFFWIRQGLQAAQDPVDGQLVFLNDEGRVVGRAKLPADFSIEEIQSETNDIRLSNGQRQVTVPRTIDPAVTNALQDAPVAANGATRRLRLIRKGPQQLLYQDDRRTGARALDVRSVAGGNLAQAYEVGPGTGDNRYLVSEEIVGTKPSLQVKIFVRRYDRTGKVTGIASIPLDGMDVVPRDFITVTGTGVVRTLVPTESGVKINEIEFTAPPAAGRRLKDDELKTLGRTLKQIPVDTNVTGDASTRFRTEVTRLEIRVATPPITRDAIVANARAFLTVNWVMLPENYSKSGVENACEPRAGKFWARPRNFTADMVGTTIGPMPYRWGGDDTPATFKLRTQLGALAGSVCTCRQAELNYCLFKDSAGTDCSGFVSRAWGIEKRGTAGLLDVATDLTNIADLRPGDAFDWPQRHVRLLVSTSTGASVVFTVLESSTRLDCQGVCQRTYRPSELNGWRMIRYRGVTEGANVSGNPAGANATATATAEAKR